MKPRPPRGDQARYVPPARRQEQIANAEWEAVNAAPLTASAPAPESEPQSELKSERESEYGPSPYTHTVESTGVPDSEWEAGNWSPPARSAKVPLAAAVSNEEWVGGNWSPTPPAPIRPRAAPMAVAGAAPLPSAAARAHPAHPTATHPVQPTSPPVMLGSMQVPSRFEPPSFARAKPTRSQPVQNPIARDGVASAFSRANAIASSSSSSSASSGRYTPPHTRERLSSLTPRDSTHASAHSLSRANGWPTYDETPHPPRPTSAALDRALPRAPIGALAPAPRNGSPPRLTAPPLEPRRVRSGPGYARSGSAGAPPLHVFGDSFVGPMKLLSEESARCTTFKGASAKGLNNPHSVKQVAVKLVPQLDRLLAPERHIYVPSTGRWVLLIFGNVDLQINYIWQLLHKPLSAKSFAPSEPNSYPAKARDIRTAADEGGPNQTLAHATETSLTGCALGPERFVDAIVGAYSAFLEREIVNGPIGERIREAASSSSTGQRRRPPGRVLVAAALPPLVEDEQLHRIPEKYVERLEDEHEKSQMALRRAQAMGGAGADDRNARDMAALSMYDRPITPPSSAATSSARSDASTAATSPPPSPPKRAPIPRPAAPTAVSDLLAHNPPLCTLAVRVQMTNRYNSLMRDFVARHPDVLAFIDISAAMLAKDAEGGWGTGSVGEVDRGTWACPVDPTNVHPLWEPTLPLWREEMQKAGVPADEFQMAKGAEETFREYELDKKRRTMRRDAEWAAEAEAGSGAVQRKDEGGAVRGMPQSRMRMQGFEPEREVLGREETPRMRDTAQTSGRSSVEARVGMERCRPSMSETREQAGMGERPGGGRTMLEAGPGPGPGQMGQMWSAGASGRGGDARTARCGRA